MHDWWLSLSRIFNRELVGTDEFGNKYFQEKKARRGRDGTKGGHKKRWVIYKGPAEASRVPAAWHGWLHYRADLPAPVPDYEWLSPHTPNLTGTDKAFNPQANKKSLKADHDSTHSHYSSWTP